MSVAAESLAQKPEPSSSAETASTVLVADDDGPTRRILSRILRGCGYQVLEAETGLQALELAREDMPDLAILDREMPEMDGIELLTELRRLHGASFHALMVSGMSDPAQVLEAFDAGADDFIAKPYRTAELVRRVSAAERVHGAYLGVRRAREREEQLRVYAAEASALLAHDLNNGLAIVLCNLDFVSRFGGVEDEEVVDALDSSLTALKRMAALVSNLADIGRLEDAVMRPKYLPCDVSTLLESVANLHAPGGQRAEVRLEVVCPSGIVGQLDAGLIERVVHNLVGNAMRYTNEGGFTRITAEIEEGSEECPTLVIRVMNTGDPIPERLRSSIFDKYGMGSDRKRKRGMGLYFCRLACEAHGGTISLEPAEGLTVFAVRLPLR